MDEIYWLDQAEIEINVLKLYRNYYFQLVGCIMAEIIQAVVSSLEYIFRAIYKNRKTNKNKSYR